MSQKTWRRALLMVGGISTSFAFGWIKANNNEFNHHTSGGDVAGSFTRGGATAINAKPILATSALQSYSESASQESSPKKPLRTYDTPADEFFGKRGSLPFPAVVHESFHRGDVNNLPNRKNILVIGDVHGCADEMLLLHEKAIKENGGMPFDYVILVGDLCNKGPKSVQVIHHVRNRDRWLAVRGNHDNAALKAALGDPRRRQGKKYQWVTDTTNEDDTLTDDDVLWLSELPYTIRIPSNVLEEGTSSSSVDTVIVHAGLIPDIPLEDQTVETMITIRDVEMDHTSGEYIYHRRKKPEGEHDGSLPKTRQSDPEPWAQVWKGPFRVIFGHDARRGLQRYDEDWAIGLDTGCVYGKKLTGIILPSRKLISVDALEVHCPISNKD